MRSTLYCARVILYSSHSRSMRSLRVLAATSTLSTASCAGLEKWGCFRRRLRASVIPFFIARIDGFCHPPRQQQKGGPKPADFRSGFPQLLLLLLGLRFLLLRMSLLLWVLLR